MPAATRSTIGRLSTASSTRIGRRGVRPYVQLGFMPRDLSVEPEPYQHHWSATDRYSKIFTGWSYPPKDYEKWSELVYQWAKHCVERYGAEEVATWYWQTWNEANIGYWQGTPEEFRKLARLRASPACDGRCRPRGLAGPTRRAAAGSLRATFSSTVCGARTTRPARSARRSISFPSTPRVHAASLSDGHVRMGIAEQLRTIDDGFKIVASFPELKDKPIVIGESDPEGCAACQGPQLAYRNGTMYSSYTAAVFARKHELAERHGVNLEGALTWAFEFEDQPYFAGFRSLATNGIDKPVLNVFRMFAKMRGEQLAVESDAAVSLDAMMRDGVRGKPDVSAFASRDGDTLYVMLWHYHDDDLAGPGGGGRIGTRQSAGRERHGARSSISRSTPTTAMPTRPGCEWARRNSQRAEQYAELEQAGHLATGPAIEPVDDRRRRGQRAAHAASSGGVAAGDSWRWICRVAAWRECISCRRRQSLVAVSP